MVCRIWVYLKRPAATARCRVLPVMSVSSLCWETQWLRGGRSMAITCLAVARQRCHRGATAGRTAGARAPAQGTTAGTRAVAAGAQGGAGPELGRQRRAGSVGGRSGPSDRELRCRGLLPRAHDKLARHVWLAASLGDRDDPSPVRRHRRAPASAPGSLRAVMQRRLSQPGSCRASLPGGQRGSLALLWLLLLPHADKEQVAEQLRRPVGARVGDRMGGASFRRPGRSRAAGALHTAPLADPQRPLRPGTQQPH